MAGRTAWGWPPRRSTRAGPPRCWRGGSRSHTLSPDLLRRLVAEAEAEVVRRRSARPEAELVELAAKAPPARGFVSALRGDRLRVIAEAKARTPLMGTLAEDYSPGALAALYAEAGAAALSILCQETSFGGSPEHLAQARAATDLPIMRKDFVVTEHQLLEARALGADAVLLIAGALDRASLESLHDTAGRLGLDALVEVHDEPELERALAAGARAVGVNHRDLSTFEVDIGLTERLRPLVPAGVVLVSESGIRSADDARRMRDGGADAILVGEALMRAADPKAKLRELSV